MSRDAGELRRRHRQGVSDVGQATRGDAQQVGEQPVEIKPRAKLLQDHGVGPERDHAHVVAREFPGHGPHRCRRGANALAAHRAGRIDHQNDRAARAGPLPDDEVVVVGHRVAR